MIDTGTTVDQLKRIPDLAAEVFATWGHPNPGPRAGRSTRKSGSREPTDLVSFDALRLDSHGLLAKLTECIRLTWEAMPADDRPDLTNPPTWTTEAGWLLQTWEWAQVNLDLLDLDWIRDEVRTVHRELCQTARTVPPLVLRCKEVHDMQACGGRLVARDADGQDTADWVTSRWCYCPECGRTYTYDAELRKLGTVDHFTLAECAQELGVPYGTARRWKHEQKLFAAGRDHRGRDLFDLNHVRRVAERSG